MKKIITLLITVFLFTCPLDTHAFNVYIGGKDINEFTWVDTLMIPAGAVTSWGVHELSHSLALEINKQKYTFEYDFPLDGHHWFRGGTAEQNRWNGRAGFVGQTFINVCLYFTPLKDTPFHFGYSFMSTTMPLTYEPHTGDLLTLEKFGADWKAEKIGFTAINAVLTAPLIKITW